MFTLLLGLLCLRSVAQTGIAEPELAHCDASMQQFMSRWNVLGASVAISKDGKLVYERAFGYADVARTVPMQPHNLLRVASISKTVTALAIMKLVEDGQLSLSHKIFGSDGYLNGRAYAKEIRDPRLRSITVQHLLEHSAGWDRAIGCDGYEGCDPIDFPTHVAKVMHVPNPVGDSTIICYMLRQGLNFGPGTRFAYCNVGYLILGKVLEAVTQQSYETWVRQHVLEPTGVLEAHLGHNLPAAHLERESSYLSRYRMRSCYNGSRQVPAAYGGFNLEAMGAHGGWLFTARDLVRLALAADGFDSRPDLLSAATLQRMTQPSAATPQYGKGWMLDGDTWWHTGHLDGTASLLERTANGYTWAILLNTANGSPQFWEDLKSLGWFWIAGVKTWPTHDLFAPAQNASHLQVTAPDAAHTRLAWTNGSGTHRLVLLRADSPSTAFPLDGTAYAVSSMLADGTIIAANTTDSTADLAHLNPQRTYYARIIEYRQDATTGNQPMYTLDGNPREVLSPAALSQQFPPLALTTKPAKRKWWQFGAAARQVVNASNAPTTESSSAPEGAELMPSVTKTRFLRVRRAWRAGFAHLGKQQ
ncbi:serine hydrolase domain-containing protein [Hymenobacter negativus]|uniref:serine hydrolase domain-containing protein n=1 Tax=Hymenobacter negativus TaxID=2795026 RepID=UPI00293D3502|nr:serine hydrolase domain-containing protein [Hymenobacter negativus]